jgi:peroxiredoxin
MIISVNGKNEGGGRFVCTNEIIKFSFNDIEKKTEITGGENKYFQDNMFLLFSIPTKVTIDNDYKNNYAKEYYDLKQHNFSVLLYKYLEYENNILQTVKQNKTKFTVLTHLWDNRDYISTKTLDSCYRMLSVAFPKNTLTTLLYEYIKKGKKIYIGSKLPKFGVNNLNNELIKSDSFYKRNTYTLIHFWATWCKPCIEESKKIDSFINKYTIKDLSVIYISLDTNKSLWKKYLNEKKVTGEHFIDEKGFSSNVAKIFNLSYIPFNVLIDSTNRIVDLKYDEVKIKTLLSK